MSATVDKALLLIEALARHGEPIGVSELGRLLNLNKSTVYRLLDTYCRRGFVRQDPVTGRYGLTMKLWELGVGVVAGLGLRQAARDALERVARDTAEATMLGVIQDHDGLIIDKVDSHLPLRIFSPIGTRVPLCSSSIGRALLAYQPPAFVTAVLDEFAAPTPHGLQTRAEVEADLARIRAEGYSRSHDEWHVGISGVGAPIWDDRDQCVGAFCITGPSARMEPERMPDLAERCVVAAREVSALLGHRYR